MASTGWREEAEEKFFRLKESDSTDGCFVCVLKRDQEQAEPETVQDILARAAAKGLLGNLIALDPPDQAKRKKRDKRKGAAATLPPLFPLPPAVADTNGLLNDPHDPFPRAAAVHMRAGSMSISNLTGDDSCRSSFVLNEVPTTPNQASVAPDEASTALNWVSAEADSDSSSTNEAANKRTEGQRHRSKGPRTKRTQRRKSKSKSRTRTTKTHRSRQSRKRRLTKRQARVRAHALAPAAGVHPLTPTPPPGTRSVALKSQSSPRELQKLHSRRRPQQGTLKEGLAPQPAVMDLKAVIKLKKEVEKYEKEVVGRMQVVLPPISASSRTYLSSDFSSHLLEASTNPSSAGSYLSSGLSRPTSRSESRDTARSGVRLWH